MKKYLIETHKADGTPTTRGVDTDLTLSEMARAVAGWNFGAVYGETTVTRIYKNGKFSAPRRVQ